MITDIIIGDYYADGHGRYSTVKIDSNLSQNEIESALRLSETELGIYLDRLCEGSNKVPKKIFEPIMAEIGDGELKASIDYWTNDDYVRLNFDAYFELFVVLIKHSNKEFTYKRIHEKADRILIGGCGLFN